MKFFKFSKYTTRKLTFIFFLGFIFLFSGLTSIKAQKKYTIVLDAGHGGKDHGASRGKYIEKKIALNLALKAGEILKKEKNLEIIYTRKQDVFIELHNRARIANEKNADLFVSIHCNANKSNKPHGSETYVLGLRGNKENLEIVKKENEVILLEDNYEKNYDYDPNSPETVIALSVLQEENLDLSLAFGGLLQNNFRKLKRYDRKVKQANFLVLRETAMPSVLIELGFISNKAEGFFLSSKSGQYKMAKAIADAIKKYIKQIDLNSVDELLSSTTSNDKVKTVSQSKTTGKKTLNTTKTNNYTEDTVTKSNIEKGILFRVQIAASKNKISEKNSNFKGLNNVESLFFEGYHKYFFGKTTDFQEVKQMQTRARKAGHKGAFVVAFKNGKKISIKEALNSL